MIRSLQSAFTALVLATGAVFVPTAVTPDSAHFTPTWGYAIATAEEAAERRADDEFAALLKRDDAIDRVLMHEGGLSRHPADPGGATHYGITRAEARRHGYSGSMAKLPLSRARGIYAQLWIESGASRFENYEMAISAFDAYVAHGPRARLWYSGLSGVSGCRAINAKRLSVYRGSKNWKVFGRGWSKRVRYNVERCA